MTSNRLSRFALCALLPACAATPRAAPAPAGVPAVAGEQARCPDSAPPVHFIAWGEVEVAPGAVDTLYVLEVCPGFGSPRPLESGEGIRWSLADGAPASISATGGALSVARSAAHNSTFGVTAVRAGKPITAVVRVVDRRLNPLVGTWTQLAGVPCGSAEERLAGDDVIREVAFRADGTFSVTWLPFESYKDFWGTYTYDPSSGRLRLQPIGGNFVPANLDAEGQAEVDAEGELKLTTMSLGSRPERIAFCSARFRRH